ncbi:MAG TPA: lysophospholipid acyltransferase family protein [Baekduia sp.]|nr:lysophospholipid acyltransferase family protein [Baekduia sp.]
MSDTAEIERAEDDSLARKDVGWTHGPFGGALREGLGRVVLSPLMNFYTARHITGRENLDDLEGPVIFVANHASHMDTPAILRALPKVWRQRTVVAAAADYFYSSKVRATFVSVLFNTVPIERRPGAKGSTKLDHIDRMLEEGYNLLLFPEGTRRAEESGARVRRGAAAIAAKHDAYIVPIYLEGTARAFPPGRFWFRRRGALRRHPVTIHIGKPILPERPEESHVSITARIAHFFESSRKSSESRRERAKALLHRKRGDSDAQTENS